MSDNDTTSDTALTSDIVPDHSATNVALPKKRGRPRGSTSKVVATHSHLSTPRSDDMTAEIQKLILKKRIKKYVDKYMTKHQRPPVTYNETLYGDTSHTQQASESDGEEPINDEPEQYQPPLQIKRPNKYRQALLR
jgi:predicted DNA-binding WGR domain protein